MGNADDSSCAEWNLCNLEAAQNQIIRMDKVKSQERLKFLDFIMKMIFAVDEEKTPEGKKLPVEHCIKGTKDG